MIKLGLCDDEELFRKGMALLLGSKPGLEVVLEASNGALLLEKLRKSKNHPDVLLMDINMPDINGIEATKIIRKEFPDIMIIALTSYNSSSFLRNMIQVGASSYLVKDSSPDRVIHTIKKVHETGFYYDDKTVDMISKSGDGLSPKDNIDDILSDREKQVLQLICEQKTTTEMAEELFLSPRTVEGHRNNLLLKTESRNMAGLVIFALQNNLVSI